MYRCTTKTTVVVANVANLSTTTYTPATALTPGHTYTWYDAAVSTNGSVISYDVTTPETLTLAAGGPCALRSAVGHDPSRPRLRHAHF